MEEKRSVEWIAFKPRGGKIEFGEILSEAARRGISRLLIEGGGETAASALESKEVDEIFFFIAPVLIGGKNAKTAFEGEGFGKIRGAPRLERMSTKMIGGDLLVNARVRY
jgi:diaminohydroxyphosphoribosylaminopyrimidine deaminase/5-amino-6-(5-phosphoribosylamino)uracil reductase